MTQTSLYKVIMPLPLESEQIEILDNSLGKLDQTISTIEKEITLTQDYKTALITEAVTSKIDVRDFEIPKTQEEDPDSYRDEDLEVGLSLAAEGKAEYLNEAMEG